MNIKSFSSFLLVTIFVSLTGQAQTINRSSSGQIKQALKKLQTLGTVLYVAAHPDDENTRLLSYLSNDRHYRTLYLSMTRGDGGQNLIGKEQSEELGLIRTRELLAARSVDGAEQLFTKANDFGYSKSPEETFKFWDKEAALGDVVWAIRKYRPDVIITRFPTTGEGGHGHHTASGILAVEAYKAAADPLQYPEQLKYVSVWKAKRIFHNSFNWRGQIQNDYSDQLQLDVGGYNPLLGQSYGEMAAASRTMHKSQGFGVGVKRGAVFEYFKKLDGDTAVVELFEGINTSWARIKGTEALQSLAVKTLADFDSDHPENSVTSLIAMLPLLQKIEDSYWKQVKTNEVLQLIADCSGLFMEASATDYFGIPGNALNVDVSVLSRLLSGITIDKININNWDTLPSISVSKNELVEFSSEISLSEQSSYSNPYWLNMPHTQGSYVVNDITKTGIPWNDPAITANIGISINGQKISYSVPVTYKWVDPVKGELQRPVEIVPAVSVKPEVASLIFTSRQQKNFQVAVTAMVDSIYGVLNVTVPEGWTIAPAKVPVTLNRKGMAGNSEFTITPPAGKWIEGKLNPEIRIAFVTSENSYDQSVNWVTYDHIPPILHLTSSAVKLVNIDLKSSAKKIGYLQGAGDQVANYLELAGFEVTLLDDHKILNEPLSEYDAILIGIRAYNTIENIDAYYDTFMNYVEGGGVMVAQYNTSNFLSKVSTAIGPYPFKISRNRVTDELATVTFTKPDHFLLNKPNKITQADFADWVQERGLYFAEDLAPEYQTIFAMHDEGDENQNGSLIIAGKGKGYFIYTGISFFRQLPAGVPGSYRLLVNLINAGKSNDK